jgi:hypothetical protein
MRYHGVDIREKAVIFDGHKWGDRSNDFAISPSCQYIAVHPRQHERVYLYYNSGEEIKSFSHPNGGELGIAFWPDNYHLIIPGYDYQHHGITVIQYSWRDDERQFPFANTIVRDTSQKIIGCSRNGRYLAGYTASQNHSWYHDRLNRLLHTCPGAAKAVFSENEEFVIFIFDGGADYYSVNLATNEIVRSPLPVNIWATEKENFICFSKEAEQGIFSKNHEIVIRRMSDLQLVRSVNTDLERPTTGCLSADGEFYFFGCGNGDILAVTSSDFTCIGRYISGSPSRFDTAIQQIAVSLDNKTLIATTETHAFVFSVHYF